MHPETRVVFGQASFFDVTFFISIWHHFQVALFCEVRIFTSLPRRPLSPSAPCSINVPVVLILEKYISDGCRTSYRHEGATAALRAFRWWAIDLVMAQCAATTQEEEESHMAEIILFHGPVKAEGSQHLWQPQKQLWKMDSPTLEFFQFCVYSPRWCLTPHSL